MKYIRTKNGIYRTTKNFVVGKEHYVAWHDFYEEIINEADTIEELCDEFKVVKYGAYGKLNPQSLNDFKILKQHNNYSTAQIFGYIMWLDENNILQTKVVAKMNDKGDLELL